MDENRNTDVFGYEDGSDIYGLKPKAVPAPERNIGIDTNDKFYENVINAGRASQLDIAKLESLTQVSNNRETIMQLIDTMSEDATISAALEIYAEDATEPNDKGEIIWVASDNADISKYITYLLDTMNVNKHIYKWVYSLCKYGDLYLKLYRESEYDDVLFKSEEEIESSNKKHLHEDIDSSEKSNLNEDVVIKAYSKSDHYSHYIDMVPNPAEMFELRRLGKSYAYIKANIVSQAKKNDIIYGSAYKYSFKRKDVEVYDATNFVHAALEDNSSRIPEEIEIFMTDSAYDSGDGIVYTVNRGQPLFYNAFKIWRMINLIENALLLNRLTKSSIIRLIEVQVGDMPKEQVGPHLLGIKQLMEQKAALSVDNGITEYTNPGPVENNIYVPKHGEVGAIDIKTVNDDPSVKGLDDVEYFKNKLYSQLKIPKAFLGDTEDSAGFNGGSSLSLLSSRYAKTVKRIQNTIIQALTDAINLMLIDKGLDRYINKFELKMQAPTTQEERDRKEAEGNKINLIQDILNLIDNAGIESSVIKLKALKALLSNVISDNEVIDLISEEIEKMEATEEEETSDMDDGNDTDISADFNFGGGDLSSSNDLDFSDLDSSDDSMESDISSDNLPTPEDLGAGDFTDLNGEL